MGTVMNVSGIGGSGGVTGIGAASWSGASRRAGGPGAVGRMQSAVLAMARSLNTPPSQLVRQLGSGQSMISVGAAAGMSRDAVLATVTRAVAAAVPQGAAPLGGDLLQTVAGRIANTTTLPAGFSVRTPS